MDNKVTNERSERRTRTRVVLVRGPIVFSDNSINNEAVPSIGMAYLLGYLRKQGIEALLIDAIAEGLNQSWPIPNLPGFRAHGLTFDRIVQMVPVDADLIGFSLMFSGEWPVQRSLIQRLREHCPKALFLGGGEHATALAEYILRDCPELDLCVHGEGEEVLANVAECLFRGEDPRLLTGVSFLDDQGVFQQQPAHPRIRSIDRIPWPHWPEGYLEKFWQAGKSYGVQSERDMPLMISRGCPYRCTFCSSEEMWTTRYILRDVADVVDEITTYIQKYDIKAIQLYDLTAITNKTWAIAFCNRLLEKNIAIQWSLPSGTRSEALDEESLTLFQKTGCNYLVYAPESGSQETLKAIAKKISLDRMVDSLRVAHKLGLVLRTNLIIGFPGETLRQMVKTFLFGFRLAFLGVDEVSINIFSPYPGTVIFKNLVQSGRLVINDSYFMALTSLNGDYSRLPLLTFNDHVGPKALGAYRLFFMTTNYMIGYLSRPYRIWRTLRVLLTGRHAETVLEHRLKDLIARKKGENRSNPNRQ
ncbi:MAG: B12-binding domain-containing radical SAM protein [Magnetococcales bacterium]|nr:B12-binding domain-containing radical SAM protein [Magnetococcales bacterium]